MTAALDGKGWRDSRWLFWGLFFGGLLLLLSIFSAGFFLYAVLVTVIFFVFATAWASAGVLGLEVRRELEASEIELGEAVTARLVLENAKDLPTPWLFWRERVAPGLDVEGVTCGFQSLARREIAEHSYTLHSLRRGLFRVGPAVVEISDPLGLVRRFKVDREARFLTVLPKSVDLSRGWPLGHRPIHEVPRRRSLFEDPTRFLGIRDYRHGDELRRVHWRATARSGRLQVKLYEPAVLEGALVAVEMGESAHPGIREAGDAGDPSVELTVTTAASLVEFVLTGDQAAGLISNGADAAEGYPEDWRGGTFRRLADALDEGTARRKLTAFRPLEVEAGKGAWQRERLRAALARLEPASGPSLAEVLEVELPHLPRSLVLLVVTPRLDAALGATVGALRRSGIEVAVVWTGIAAATPDHAMGAVPEGVPIYPVADEAGLEDLGGVSL